MPNISFSLYLAYNEEWWVVCECVYSYHNGCFTNKGRAFRAGVTSWGMSVRVLSKIEVCGLGWGGGSRKWKDLFRITAEKNKVFSRS